MINVSPKNFAADAEDFMSLWGAIAMVDSASPFKGIFSNMY